VEMLSAKIIILSKGFDLLLVRASPPRGSICYFWAYDNLFSERTKKVSPTANFYSIFYVSNRIALDFGSIFLEIEAKSYRILLPGYCTS
jgi:hypothetical protein